MKEREEEWEGGTCACSWKSEDETWYRDLYHFGCVFWSYFLEMSQWIFPFHHIISKFLIVFTFYLFLHYSQHQALSRLSQYVFFLRDSQLVFVINWWQPKLYFCNNKHILHKCAEINWMTITTAREHLKHSAFHICSTSIFLLLLNYYGKSFIIAEQMTNDAVRNIEKYFC